jgi:hypothetical protein
LTSAEQGRETTATKRRIDARRPQELVSMDREAHSGVPVSRDESDVVVVTRP